MSDYYQFRDETGNPIDYYQLVNDNNELCEEIERLNNIIDKKEQFLGDNIKRLEREVVKRDNIINELEKCIKDKYYEAVDYQTKIRQSDLMQGDYPVSYYLSEQNEQLCNYFLNRLKDLQELKGSDSNE